MKRSAGLVALLATATLCATTALAEPSPAQVRRTFEAAAAKDFDAARKAAGGDPVLGTYVEWRVLREIPVQPFARYRSFLDSSGHWPDSATIQARAEEVIADSLSAREQLAFFETRPPIGRAGRIARAEALLKEGRTGEAVPLLRAIWVEDDFGRVEETLFLQRHGQHLDGSSHAARLARLLWDGRTDAAERIFDRVTAEQRALATARIRLQEQAYGVDAAIAAVPASLRNDAGLAFDRLKWRRAKGRHDEVPEMLLSVQSEPGSGGAWWAERGLAARLAMEAGDFRLAYRIASSHRQTSGAAFAEAEWLAGWLALRFLDEPADGFAHFERFFAGVGTPISLGRGAYWAGRALAAQGDRRGAQTWYRRAAEHPTTFYGQLAAAELGEPLRFPPTNGSQPSQAVRAAFARQDLVQLTGWLCALGEQDEIRPFVSQLGRNAAGDEAQLELVYDLARDCARPDLVVVVAKAAIRNGAEPLSSFPVPDMHSVFSPSLDEVGPDLILAVARQESQFDAGAASRAGARGLMQLMPTTARSVARSLGLPFDLEALTADPDFNVQLGTWYLGRQLERYDGSVALAAAAYNAGPGRVGEWLERHGDPRGSPVHELVDWIELIPFAETRNYVQRVIESQAVYAALLGNGGARLVPVPGARQGTAALRVRGDRS
jgi:soluble lytic murein transglycosylase